MEIWVYKDFDKFAAYFNDCFRGFRKNMKLNGLLTNFFTQNFAFLGVKIFLLF